MPEASRVVPDPGVMVMGWNPRSLTAAARSERSRYSALTPFRFTVILASSLP